MPPLNEMPPAGTTSPDWMTLSFYPLATRAALRIVLVASVVFTAAVQVFNRTVFIKHLLLVITLVGGAMALLAVAQDLTHANAIYWLVPRDNYVATAGPFVNYNNYAQFANLALGSALGLMLARLTEAQRSDPLPSGNHRDMSVPRRGGARRKGMTRPSDAFL